jgi:hypothetical protein
VAFQRRKVMALHWKGKEDALMSTMHNAEILDVHDKKIMMKQVANAYNNTMGGIHLID